MFKLFRTYVASVISRCCKIKSNVTHIIIGPTCYSRLSSSPWGQAARATSGQVQAPTWDTRVDADVRTLESEITHDAKMMQSAGLSRPVKEIFSPKISMTKSVRPMLEIRDHV